jgi:hypothetical protein
MNGETFTKWMIFIGMLLKIVVTGFAMWVIYVLLKHWGVI